MELPQPRHYGAQGKSTHDFLSLYSQVQDPIPPQGGYIKTQDFLQPLERSGRNGAKEESTVEEITTEEKPPPPIAPASGEHVLPGGIGTYSITHISSCFNQRVPKPEGTPFTAAQANAVVEHNEENSNCSSHTGSRFMLWEEPAVEKGKTGKENRTSDYRNSAPVRKIGGAQWAALERPAQLSSNIATNRPSHLTGTTTFTSRSSSQPPFQKSQSFMDMIKSAKAAHSEDGEDEEEYNLKKEASPQLISDLTVKVGSGGDSGTDQKPNTPRSKHSATEQRRRSKINDRFHMLRELIPRSDQKRDKASLLLEVIEYIQYLQEKVHKYEGSYQEWDQELPKLMPWQRNNKHSKDPDTNHNSNTALTTKFEENGIDFSLTSPSNEPKVLGSDMKTVTNLKAIDHHSGLANQALQLRKNVITPGGNANIICPMPAGLASDSGLTNAARNKLKEQESTVESGAISVSTVYSQGLLNTLRQALQSSGVDLSLADISVQIDLGKRANSSPIDSTSAIKDHDIRDSNQVMGSSRGASCRDEPGQERKRLRTS